MWSSYAAPDRREQFPAIGEGDIVVWGALVYAGKHPNKLTPFIAEHLKGSGNPAILLATYGGRSFDNALAEMRQLSLQGGLRPIAAAAVPMPHAFGHGIGAGYPTPDALAAMDRWSDQIDPNQPGTIEVPGDAAAPYYRPLRDDGQPANFLKAVPDIDHARCTHCHRCEAICPLGSIADAPAVTGICIKCMACVSRCPEGAITFSDPELLSHIRMLQSHCQPQQPYFRNIQPSADI